MRINKKLATTTVCKNIIKQFMTVLLLILKFKLWKFIEKDKLLMGWLVRTIFLKYKVMFDNNFCFLFLETCFWEYKEKKKQFSCIFEIKNMFTTHP